MKKYPRSLSEIKLLDIKIKNRILSSPRNINSATTPLRGAVENTMLPLITAYESDFCLTPLKNTNTDASLPYS